MTAHHPHVEAYPRTTTTPAEVTCTCTCGWCWDSIESIAGGTDDWGPAYHEHLEEVDAA